MVKGPRMDQTEQIARLVLRLANAEALDATLRALQDGTLTRCAGAATRGRVASGRTGVDQMLKELDNIWCADPTSLDASELALMLSSIAAGTRVQREQSSSNEVVWTGPPVKGSFLRATRQVVQDIIQNAHSELLVVGYWLAGKGDTEGIISDIIEQISKAVDRGVNVTMVLDMTAEKKDGKNNLETLQNLWPGSVPMPEILTWKIPEDDAHLKLHAKVLVADKSDALVTSANLTMYALDRNMEMGVRVSGIPAERIAHHFDLLRQAQVLVPFE